MQRVQIEAVQRCEEKVPGEKFVNKNAIKHTLYPILAKKQKLARKKGKTGQAAAEKSGNPVSFSSSLATVITRHCF